PQSVFQRAVEDGVAGALAGGSDPGDEALERVLAVAVHAVHGVRPPVGNRALDARFQPGRCCSGFRPSWASLPPVPLPTWVRAGRCDDVPAAVVLDVDTRAELAANLTGRGDGEPVVPAARSGSREPGFGQWPVFGGQARQLNIAAMTRVNIQHDHARRRSHPDVVV